MHYEQMLHLNIDSRDRVLPRSGVGRVAPRTPRVVVRIPAVVVMGVLRSVVGLLGVISVPSLTGLVAFRVAAGACNKG